MLGYWLMKYRFQTRRGICTTVRNKGLLKFTSNFDGDLLNTHELRWDKIVSILYAK